MADIPETYTLETLEQLRAIADDLRVRILHQLERQAMTVTQLAELLDEVPSRLHYHVRELEKVGLLKLVETREKGGILEKYYRAVAKSIIAPETLFQGVPPDEAAAALTEIAHPLFQGFIRAFQTLLRTQAWNDPDLILRLTPEHYWMTAQEFQEVSKQIEALLEQYKTRRGIQGERERTVLMIAYDTAMPREESTETAAAEAAPEPAKTPKRDLNIIAGIAHYGRADLEEVVAKGEILDMYMFGSCIFADDVTPDLVDRAVHSFRIWGKLNAPPEVRAVLKRKGGETNKK